MFAKLVVVISMLIRATSGTQNICLVEGIENLNWLHKSEKIILDNHEGVIETFPMLNLDDAFIEDSPYLKATIENDTIVISTSPEFAKIEERQDDLSITATLVTVCAGEKSKLEYVLELKDTNNHAPRFEKNVYDYIFYDIIPNTNEFNLNEFEEVAVRDVDNSNNAVTFTIEQNDYLELRGAGLQDPGDLHRFVAHLSLKQDIVAPFDMTLVISATDSGTPSLSSNAKICITVLRSETPDFTQSLYEAYINKDREIVMKNGDIALDNVTNLADIRFDIAEEYDNYFNLKIGDTITLKLSEDQDPSGLISEQNPTLTIPIYAEGQDPSIYAETAVLLNMEVLLDGTSIENSAADSEEETTTDLDDNTTDSDDNTTDSDDNTTDSDNNTTDSDDNATDSDDNTTDSNEDPDDSIDLIDSTTKTPTTTERAPAYVYTELRGLKYWLDVNRTYVILFSVLTGCGVIIFFIISVRGTNARIR